MPSRLGQPGLPSPAPDLRPTLRAAMAVSGPAVAIPVDYSDNHLLMEQLGPEMLS